MLLLCLQRSVGGCRWETASDKYLVSILLPNCLAAKITAFVSSFRPEYITLFLKRRCFMEDQRFPDGSDFALTGLEVLDEVRIYPKHTVQVALFSFGLKFLEPFIFHE